MEKFLPVWIIGAPFLYLVVDWIIAPKASRTPERLGQYSTGRPVGSGV
jgi:hypothetical protein